jgi:hypothetical protein
MSPGSTAAGRTDHAGNRRRVDPRFRHTPQHGRERKLLLDPFSADCITCMTSPHDMPDLIFAPHSRITEVKKKSTAYEKVEHIILPMVL